MSNNSNETLPNTAYIVLGILAQRGGAAGLSGYEVRKWVEGLRFFYWSPAQSQIYSELRRLAKLGYVTSEKIAQEGKPNKRLYAITTHGRNVFQEWINNQPLEPTVLKHPLLLRLYFGESADLTQLTALLDTFIAETKEALGQLAIVEEFAENQSDMAYQSLVAQWGLRYYEAELATAKVMLHKLVDFAPDNHEA